MGQQRKKVAQMKQDGADEADVKKQTEVLNDTLTVIPDTRQRLQKYCNELREFLSEHYQDFEATQAGSGEPSTEETAVDTQVRDLVLEGRQLLGAVADMLGVVEDKAPDVHAGSAGGTGDCDDDDV